jgi:hypothetical protein
MQQEELRLKLKAEEAVYRIKKIEEKLKVLLYKLHDVVMRQNAGERDLSMEMDRLLLEKENKTRELKEAYRDWYKWK